MSYLSDILDYTYKIRLGELDLKLPVLGYGSFSKLADNINSITDLANDSISDCIKTDLVNTDFVFNVSQTFSINKNDLVNILERSKSLSNINMEKINLVELIQNNLNLYQNSFNNHKLSFKYIYEKDDIYIDGDKKLLDLVLSKLIDNILNYSLSNTKVHINIYIINDKVHLSFKNVSIQEIYLANIKNPTLSSIRFCENILYIQNIKFDITQEASLFKCIMIFG
ncbi:hypothetical protein [Clostridium sp.]|uniref:hypothetical protein n=1 Tax=Clostridium sp. TaxID=1506 RepID=UPI003F667CF2